MDPRGAGCTALVAAVIAVLLVVLVCVLRRDARRSHFYTGAALEEPTRSYAPYTGTVADGASDGAWAAGPGARCRLHRPGPPWDDPAPNPRLP